ncbi:MAG: hypothetical protein PVI53_18100 [Desulfobacteraceae bacterium]|jgi:hypothetical protein
MGKRKKQKRKKNDSVNAIMGVAWYRRQQWGRLLEISSDRDELENTYDEWKAMAEENLSILARQGYVLRKIDIDVEELLRWCKLQNRPVDGNARTEFTLVKLREQDE